jgi:methylenetetrahydrofolate--tRNA-(uracil-5-)-methyltransferase
MNEELIIIGGGLAGSEAAWQAASEGLQVTLYEMRPVQSTPAHLTGYLAELVCSNSLGSSQITKAPGLLKAELKGLGSLIMKCALETAVPAGSSLAVDRDLFAELVSERIDENPLIEIVREEMKTVPDQPVIIASGPLTSQSLTADIQRFSDEEYLYFYDAVSPIVHADSIDMSIAFRQSRYDKGDQVEGDYINCPLNKAQYDDLVEAMLTAESITLKKFEREDPNFFEGCMPVEVMAGRGRDTLAFGPLRPVGLVDPRTGKRPYAVAQLRQDNVAASLYNIVGFQTNLRWGEQRRILRMIPGLQNAEFLRYGMMHRNTYVNSPRLLQPTLQSRTRANLIFAGQITGVEGYMGNAGTGLVAGINAARLIKGSGPVIFPTGTMLGALCHYVTHADPKDFQPMKANFGLFSPPQTKMNKADRGRWYAEKALTRMRRFAREFGLRYDRHAAEANLNETVVV